jgi:hypothetical protein
MTAAALPFPDVRLPHGSAVARAVHDYWPSPGGT